MNPPGTKTLFEGKEYSSVTVPSEQLYTSGTPRYGIWLTVTDSAGRDAVWTREVGVGTSNQFFYGMDFTDYPEPKWTIITEPKTFPKAAASPPVVATTKDPNCKDSGARFTGLNGQVEVSHECTDADLTKDDLWTFAKRDMELYVNDHIRTGEDTEAILGLADMSSFVMKPESEIVLASPPDKDSKIKLLAGNLWINVKKMIEGGSMEIEMNNIGAVVKGTTFVCSSDGKQSSVQVLEGTVEVTGTTDGKKTLLSPGQKVTATGSGPGTPTSFDVMALQAEWDSVKTKAMAGTPASAPTQKSGPESTLVITGVGIAAAVIAIRRL
jgi:hypothetical protein